MKRLFLIWALATTVFYTVPMTCDVQAEELSSHSPYSISTLNFNSSDEPSGITNAPKPYSLLLITGFNSHILENELNSDATVSGVFDDFSSTKSFVLSGKYDASSRFAITGALGITQKLSTPLSQGYDSKSSLEVNLGIVYQFFDNVSYGFNFGYLDPGDVLSERANYSEDKAIIMISNQLSLSF